MMACSVSPSQREEALLRSVVFLRRSLLAAGLTGAGAAFFGIGSQEMADDAIDSLVAVPFTAEIMAGESVDLDVLGQVYAPNVAENVTLEGVSQPASGIVSVINNRIRYTSNSGFAGVDSFTYTLTAAGKSSTATIAIAVRSSVSGPQTGSGGGDAEPPLGGNSDIPGSTGLWNTVQGIDILALTPTQTINVANATQLASAITTINTTSAAGRHIVLANGNYSGSYTIYAQGTEANPVVIRPANFLGATLSGDLTICGSWVIVRGINVRQINFVETTQGSTTYKANNCRASRCVVTAPKVFLGNGASYCCVDRCELSGGQGRNIEMRPRGGDDLTFRNCFVWNLLKNGSRPDQNDRRPYFQSNFATYSLFNNETETLVAWNRFENMNMEHIIQFKGSGNYAIYNTIANCSVGFTITHRHGRRSYFGGNYLVNVGGVISIRGEGHEIIGNYYPGGRIRPSPGNIEGGSAAKSSWNSSANGVGWTFAEDAKLIGNTSSILVDATVTGQPYTPLRTLIEDHTGSITIESGARQTIDRRNAAASQVVPVAFQLSASDVGPYS